MLNVMKSWERLVCAALRVFLFVAINYYAAGSGAAAEFLAFSLRDAQRRLIAGEIDDKVTRLGGITRLAALVHDRRSGDVIVVGQARRDEESAHLDELVVALRAILVHRKAPLVSIDQTADTAATGRQSVRFEGGIADTSYGQALLDADIVLKKLALGYLPTEPWGVRAYFDLIADREATDRDISSLFWFLFDDKLALAVRPGVVALGSVEVKVKTIVTAVAGATPPADYSDGLDDSFARSLTEHYWNLATPHPELRRLKRLFDLAALAHGIGQMSPQPNLGYWLQVYVPAKFTTPVDYPVLSRSKNIDVGGSARTIGINGGIKFRALVSALADGDAEALRDLVLASRPDVRALTWRVPLERWEIPGWPSQAFQDDANAKEIATLRDRIGVSLNSQNLPVGNIAVPRAQSILTPPLPATVIAPKVTASLPPMPRVMDRLGGVLLSGTGVADSTAGVSFEDGGFSLILDGQNARLAPAAMRRFVTALWAVYLSKQPPGVSIDPIAPGIVDKHLVRYIGHGVVNSDLGRVMREADYLMKKWAVGAGRPKISGFEDVDTLMGRLGTRALNVSRRFWFVPEDLRFKKSDGMLFFEGGHMKVKTEHELERRGVPPERADGAFRDFFNHHYDEIARKYPIFSELQDYGRLVSLARFLKEKQVPLLWFLLANADLVPTEDSPGTVSELVKDSRSFAGIKIHGGVDLGADAHYVLDATAQVAITKALANSTRARTPSAPSAATPPSRELSPTRQPDRLYTVLPPSSSVTGSDRSGKLYRTDIALRHDDGEPSLELVRYFDPAQPEGGEFGQGWRLMIPYRVEISGTSYERLGDALLAKQMAVVDLLRGTRELLTFSSSRYTIAGWVPDQPAESRQLGLFPLTDGSFRLVSKLGSEFHFNPTGHLTDLLLTPDYRVHLDYAGSLLDAFAEPPYALRPIGSERVEVANARVPRRMEVQRLPAGESEVFIFDDKAAISGWSPERGTSSKFLFLAIMSDASFRLANTRGREIVFNPSGGFMGLVVAEGERAITTLVQGKQRIEFLYTLNHHDLPQIAIARVGGSKLPQVRYHYDGESRLAHIERDGTTQQ